MPPPLPTTTPAARSAIVPPPLPLQWVGTDWDSDITPSPATSSPSAQESSVRMERGTPDWSDRLHPCVVLEARRMLRSPMLVVCLMAIHAMQILLSLGNFLFDGLSVAPLLGWNQGVDGLFWMQAMLFFLFVLPLLGLGSFASDIREGTLELLRATHLSRHSIVLGKWLAHVMRASILATSLMPYAVLHYFRDGSNPLKEIILLTTLVCATGGLCALTMLISACGPSIAGRLFMGSIAGPFALVQNLCYSGCIVLGIQNADATIVILFLFASLSLSAFCAFIALPIAITELFAPRNTDSGILP